MSLRHDPDQLITSWVAETVGAGGPDYLSEVLAMVERTPQHRWAKWFPGAWTMAPAEAPIARGRVVLVAGALVLLALATAALVAVGAFKVQRPPFVLQGVVHLPGTMAIPLVSAFDGKLWATVEGGVVAIDPTTGDSSRFEVPGAGLQLTGLVVRPDAVWVADYDNSRVVRVDRSTGTVTAEVVVRRPGGLQGEDGLWTQMIDGGGAVRIDPKTAKIDLMLRDATSLAVAPNALWYLTVAERGPVLVEADPSTGVERRRIAVPAAAAKGISIDAAGNPWLSARQVDRTTVARVEVATGNVGPTFELPYEAIGGIVPIGDSIWALVAAGPTGGSRMVELGATGPTGRVEALEDGLDPDGAVEGFGSIWVPWEGKQTLYRYPADALAK